jgi:hypothetical protein
MRYFTVDGGNKMAKTARQAALQAACGTTMWGVGGVLSNVIFNTSTASPAWLVSMRLTGLASL